MTNWFDKYRGGASGRIEPRSYTAPDGQHVFLLGGENIPEPADLSPGDYTEVKQVVDLTDVDLVGATFDTFGTVMSQDVTPGGSGQWPDEPEELWKVYLDETLPAGAVNEVNPLMVVDPRPEMTAITEDFTVNGSPARRTQETDTPNNTGYRSSPAQALWPIGGLPSGYTFQTVIRINPRTGGSTGVLQKMFTNESAGLRVYIKGVTGPVDQYVFTVQHTFGYPPFSVAWDIPGWIFNAAIESPEWHLWTIICDPSVNQFRLHKDGNQSPISVLGASPLYTLDGGGSGEIAMGDFPYGYVPMNLDFDAQRLLNKIMTPEEIEESHFNLTQPTISTDPLKWTMQIRIGGVIYAERTIGETEVRRMRDFLAPVRNLTGKREVAFRLQLELA